MEQSLNLIGFSVEFEYSDEVRWRLNSTRCVSKSWTDSVTEPLTRYP